MTKWFDSNYHYLVPEIGPDTVVPARERPARRARSRRRRRPDITTRPVIVGPVTFLLLSKPSDGAPEGFRPLARLDDLLPVYGELLARLAAAGAEWVQLDEPALVSESIDDAARRGARAPSQAAYDVLGTGRAARHPRRRALRLARRRAPGARGRRRSTRSRSTWCKGLPMPTRYADAPTRSLVGGVIDGHNIWRGDLAGALRASSRPCSAVGRRRGGDLDQPLPRSARRRRRDRRSTHDS